MKFSTALLSLCLLGEASSFVVPTPKAPETVLKAYGYGSPGREVRTAEPGYSTVAGVPRSDTVGNPLVRTNREMDREMDRAGERDMEGPGKNAWDLPTAITVQGGSLRTWSTPYAERVQILMRTEGRPLNANVELWHGPDNSPQKMNIYIENGSDRQFSAVVETPRGQNAVAIRNTAQMEFPLTAVIVDDPNDIAPGLMAYTQRQRDLQVIQGGALRTFSFAPSVGSVAVLLRTDGRPLNARIELLQGPNNNKQVVEVYTEDGTERPFFIVMDTPGSGNVVRVVNTATVEFPMTASVEPYMVEPGYDQTVRRGWDDGGPSRSPFMNQGW